jgi:hypothetical protein
MMKILFKSLVIKKFRNSWQSGSSGRVPALQGQGPEFKLKYCKKKKKLGTELPGLYFLCIK